MDRSDAERPDGEPPERREGAIEVERRLDGPFTQRRENADGLALQAPQREPQDLRGARIDPLHVVECDEQRAVPSECSHDREERNAEQARVRGLSVRLPQEQRDLERAPLDRRQPRQRRFQHR